MTSLRWFAAAAAFAFPSGAAVGASSAPAPTAVPAGLQCSRDASVPEWAAICGFVADCNASGLDNLYLRTYTRGGRSTRGLGVTKDLKKGEKVFCIPSECELRSASSEVDEFFEPAPQTIHSDGFAADALDDEPVEEEKGANASEAPAGHACFEDQQIALFIAEARRNGTSSRWAKYFAMHPAVAQLRKYHPAYLKDGLLPTSANPYWQRARRQLKKCYEVYSAWRGDEAVSFDEVYNAYVEAHLYGNEVKDTETGEDDFELTPIADLCNTLGEGEPNVKWVYGKTEACFVAKRNLSQGEALACAYRSRESMREDFQLHGVVFAQDASEKEEAPAKNAGEGDGGSAKAPKEDPAEACTGLQVSEFPKPAEDADPIALNFWHFAEAHCRSPPSSRRRGTAFVADGEVDDDYDDEEYDDLVDDLSDAELDDMDLDREEL